MFSFLLLMIFGNTLLKLNTKALRAILVSMMYNAPFHTRAVKMTKRPNEKMMMSNDAKTESIIIAKSDMGRPHIIAPLRMFLYTSYFFIEFVF